MQSLSVERSTISSESVPPEVGKRLPASLLSSPGRPTHRSLRQADRQSQVSLSGAVSHIISIGLARFGKMPEVGPFGPSQRNRRFESGPLRQRVLLRLQIGPGLSKCAPVGPISHSSWQRRTLRTGDFGDLRNYSAVSHWRRTTVAFPSPQSTKPGAVTARAG